MANIIVTNNGDTISVASDTVATPGPTGAQGDQGIQGDTGIQGDQGIQGDPGLQILNGTIDPTTEGVDGDFYIQTTSDEIFGPKTGGNWGAGTSLIGPQGTQGIQGDPGNDGADGSDGADGLTVLNGTIDPTSEGVDGDFYINTVSNEIFGPKAGGTWPSGVSLVGPQGIQGDTGDTGIQGDQGIQGDPGTLTAVVEDLTPELGGDLDIGAFDIVSASGLDIAITPDTSGNILLDGQQWPNALAATTGFIMSSTDAGILTWVAPTVTEAQISDLGATIVLDSDIGSTVLAEQTIGISDDNLLEVDGTPVALEYARFTANGLEGRTEAEFKADFNLEIGTDVLAEQTIGIADDNLLEVDGTPNSGEYSRFTGTGLEGRTEAEFKADFNLEIGTDVQAFDATYLVDADIGVNVQAFDATYLVDADIGVNVQAFDATIVVDADIGVNVQAFDATILVDADIGSTVLAEQTIGITDNDLLEVDGTPNSAEYARFTANGLEGRTESEFKADFNLEIGTDVQAFDANLEDIAALAVVADNEVMVGTGAGVYAFESGATLRTSLDVDQAGTDNSTDVTLAGDGTYISISSQEITVDDITVSDLADATDGELITWSAAGVATTIGVGTTGQHLQTNGAGAVPTWETPDVFAFGEYSGEFDASGSVFPTTSNQGDWFNCTTAGTVDSQAFIVGDLLVALIDSPSTGTFIANWTIVPNISITDHADLTSIGSNTHAQIDTHLGLSFVFTGDNVSTLTNDANYQVRVVPGTTNDFAALDANGDIIDGGAQASDFATSAQGSTADSALQSVEDDPDPILSNVGSGSNNVVIHSLDDKIIYALDTNALTPSSRVVGHAFGGDRDSNSGNRSYLYSFGGTILWFEDNDATNRKRLMNMAPTNQLQGNSSATTSVGQCPIGFNLVSEMYSDQGTSTIARYVNLHAGPFISDNIDITELDSILARPDWGSSGTCTNATAFTAEFNGTITNKFVLRCADVDADIDIAGNLIVGGLGADLDVNGNSIVSVSNGDINIIPDGSGKTIIPDLESIIAINTQSGTSYIPVLADSDRWIAMTNSGSNTITIPANSGTAFPIGTKLNFEQAGAGETTISITTDTLNVNGDLTLVLNGQYAVATALKKTATTWLLFGHLVAA